MVCANFFLYERAPPYFFSCSGRTATHPHDPVPSPPSVAFFVPSFFWGASSGGGTVLGGGERSRRRRKHGGGGGLRVLLERKPGHRETRSSGEVTLSTCLSRCIHPSLWSNGSTGPLVRKSSTIPSDPQPEIPDKRRFYVVISLFLWTDPLIKNCAYCTHQHGLAFPRPG